MAGLPDNMPLLAPATAAPVDSLADRQKPFPRVSAAAHFTGGTGTRRGFISLLCEQCAVLGAAIRAERRA